MTTLVDFPVKPEARPYIDAFAENASEPEWLRRARRASLSRFAEQGFPTRRSEAWRYLDLRDLQEKPLPPAVPSAAASAPAELQLDEARARVTLVGGQVTATVLDALPPGVWLGTIRRALADRPELVRKALDARDDAALTALNAALFADGFVLDVAPGVVLDRPIEIIHYAAAPGSVHTRSVVNLGAGSRAALVETYAGAPGPYWRNDVVDVRLGDGAALDRTVLVEEGGEALHLSDTRAALGAGARLGSFALLLHGRTVRHEIDVTMAGEGAQCTLDGAFVVGGRDEVNIVTNVDHRAAGGITSELFKGVAGGRGHGAFQGRISVREGAQQTDARQTSRNLILGRRAAIDTKPELEILADDVKCAHGASVGDLDEAALFYLRARGIPTDEARRLLIEAFVREAVERVGDAAVRERLLRRLAARLAQLETE